MKSLLFALLFATLAPICARADEPAPTPPTTPATPSVTPAPAPAVTITRANFLSLDAHAPGDGATYATLKVRGRRVDFAQLQSTTDTPNLYSGKAKPKTLDALLSALNDASFTTLAGTYKNKESRVPPQTVVLTLRGADGKPQRFAVSVDDGAAPPAFAKSWDALRDFIRATVPASAYTKLMF